MSLGLLAEYFNEREGHEVIHDHRGFASYVFPNDDECYIVHIFVAKAHRLEGVAKSYADQIAQVAKVKGCSILTGSVDSTLESADESIKVLQAYGMRLAEVRGDLIFFAKEI
jgi:GNAT superfamily N-acetyltransferase